MAKLSPFRKAILSALSTVPEGYMQRIDGLRCEQGVIEHDWLFFGFRLMLMERAGLVRSKPTPSFWPSSDGMPSYALTDTGRATLASTETPDDQNHATPEMIDAAEENIRADHRSGKISKEQFQKEMLIMARARRQALDQAPQQTKTKGDDAARYRWLRAHFEDVFAVNEDGDLVVQVKAIGSPDEDGAKLDAAMPEPPFRLRDELVVALEWAWYGQSLADPPPETREMGK